MKHKIKLLITISAISLLVNAITPQAVSAQTTPSKILEQPGYYNLQIGNLSVTALSDGTFPLNMNKLLLYADSDRLKSEFAQDFLSTDVESSDNAYLVHTGGKLILIDAGAGDLLGASAGRLIKSLQNAGVQPQRIDAILLTHLHADHVGGLIRNGKIAFPNATIYIAKPERDFWLNANALKNAPEAYKPYFQYAQNSILPYAKAGKVKTFESGDQLFPGITALGTPGHTAGHTSYMLEDNGEKMLILGDLIHAGAVQFADPDIAITFDSDPKAAINTRKLIFDNAVQGKYLVAGSHLSFPGIGHIKATGKGYIWIPSNYSTIVSKY